MEEYIKRLTSDLDKNALLDENQFSSILFALEITLPTDYLEFMRKSNGGEGVIGEDGWFVRFWPLEELIEANSDYKVDKFAPALFLIGTDGGNTGFGVKKDGSTFIEVPLVGLSNENSIDRGKTFLEFLKFLEIEP